MNRRANGPHADHFFRISGEARRLMDGLPAMLNRLHGLPQDEKVQRIEEDLKAALANFGGLLTDMQTALNTFRGIAAQINELEKGSVGRDEK